MSLANSVTVHSSEFGDSILNGKPGQLSRYRRPLPLQRHLPRHLPAPDGVILDPQAADQGGVEEDAAVEDQRLLEQPRICSKSGVLKSLHSVASNSVSG